MKFGILASAKIDNLEYIALAERLGYDSAVVSDSQMLYSDCYATLAVAAARTSRIRLGTGVSISGTRIAPVTASAIATINRLAPGRTFLGLGTGDTSMRAMGQEPMKLGEFRRYAQTVRGLLDGNNTPYTYEGRTRDVRLLHQTQGYIQLEPRIPVYIAGAGPGAQRLAGSLADGLFGAGVAPDRVTSSLANVREGAERSGRVLLPDFEVIGQASPLILAPDEGLNTVRAVREAGSTVMGRLRGVWERVSEPKRDRAHVPEHFHDVWEGYCDYIDAMDTPLDRRYQQVYLGGGPYLLEEEARFVTQNGIRAVALAGTPGEIAARLRDCEAAGLTQLILSGGGEYGEKVISDFAEKIFPLLISDSSKKKDNA